MGRLDVKRSPRTPAGPALCYQALEPRQLLAGDFVISEFQATNESTLLNDHGGRSDWIEIHNAGDAAGNLNGYSITDDQSEPTKWSFPSVQLDPGDFLVVFADDDANPASGSALYTGFKLSSNGEYLGLFNPSGNVVSQYNSAAGEYPPQQIDGSYGLKFSDGGNSSLITPVSEAYFTQPTPGQPNAQAFEGVVQPVSFSVAAGFYEDSFQLALDTTTPGADIRFTVDGSEPSATNGLPYSFAFPVQESVNIRAVAIKGGYISSGIETQTYLFLDDVLNQSNNGQAPAGWPSSWGGNDVDYGIDPTVRSIEGDTAIKDALLAIPSWSITTDLDNLFDPSTGIYSNALQDGREWERPASVELLNPDGAAGFQVNAGLRIRGGFSRRDSNPKHAFRLFFRSEYGDPELNYPIHGDRGTDQFEKIDLRTAQNYSWSFNGDDENNFIAEVISRQNQGLSGQPYTRSSWLHLYLNGQYWGLFQTQERADANFAASYLGGDKDDYDVIKTDGGPGATMANEATDGNLEAYNRLFQQAVARANDGRTPNFGNNSAYFRAQGLNPDGSRNESFEVLLDVDNLVTYMTEILYSGNFDAPISNFFGNSRLNNYYAIRDRTGDQGFQFFVHDAEHSLKSLNENRNGPYNDQNFESSVSFFNPQWLHQQLMANAEYRIQFADSIQANFFNGGVYTTDRLIERWNAEAAKIDSAIVAESARWGDSKRSSPLLKSDWEAAVADVRDNIIANRNPVFLQQLRNTILRLRDSQGNYNIIVNAPLFPDIDAPGFLANGLPTVGGDVAAGTTLQPVAGDAGTIWYTTDGTDPREIGSGVNPGATSFQGSTTATSVVNAGDSWRFNDTGTNLGTAWRATGYNDSSWVTGDAQFGYGDDDEETEVSFGGNNTQKYPTTYFRKSFPVAQTDVSSVKLRFLRDDGIAAYLNGTEILRNNLPGGNITYNTTANAQVAGGGEDEWLEVNVPISLLNVGGINTLAVEIHQYAETQGGDVSSSDISFDAELIVSSVASGSGPIVLNESTTLNARLRASDGTWSALHSANFVVPSAAASADNLRITELLYHPRDGGGLEFIEIQNVTSGVDATRIDLGGVTLADGPSTPFEFSAIASLGPQERGLLVGDIAAFLVAYPNVDPSQILGEYTGSLSNSGERIRLLAADGNAIADFRYEDESPWPFAADGSGASLELIDAENTAADQLNKPLRWRNSVRVNGTPGEAASEPTGIVINEILANSGDTLVDSIELHNPTGAAINVSGWYLSDSKDQLLKFGLPATSIPAGGYVVFDESDFNPTPTSPGINDFALSGSSGDQVYLTRLLFEGGSAQAHIEDAVDFGATFTEESLGRLPNGSGQLTRLTDRSLGGRNTVAKTGPLLISEFNYHPGEPTAAALTLDPTIQDDDLEFIEIHNSSDSSVNLNDWQLRGDVDFDFGPTTLPAGESLVIVSFDPAAAANQNRLAAFETHYGVSNRTLVGPWTGGSLSNGAGRIALRAPDAPAPETPTIIPRVAVDEVLYDDLAPWEDADGSGRSLHRAGLATTGSDAASWQAIDASPGEASFAQSVPTIVSVVRDGGSIARPDLWTTLELVFSEPVSVADDALSLSNLTADGVQVDISGASFSYSAVSRTATWSFAPLPAFDAAFYSLELNGDAITTVSGNVALDGDGDGNAGGDFVDELYVAIPSDANLDGKVDIFGDGFTLLGNIGISSNATWAQGNFDADGDVDVFGDGFALLANLGRTVVPGAAASVQASVMSSAATEPVIPIVSATIQPQRSSLVAGGATDAQLSRDESDQAKVARRQHTDLVVDLLPLSGALDAWFETTHALANDNRPDRGSAESSDDSELDTAFAAFDSF